MTSMNSAAIVDSFSKSVENDVKTLQYKIARLIKETIVESPGISLDADIGDLWYGALAVGGPVMSLEPDSHQRDNATLDQQLKTAAAELFEAYD